MATAPEHHVWANLRAGAALAVGLTVGRFSFRPGLHPLAALIAGFAVLTALAELAAVPGPLRFSPYGPLFLAGYVFTVLAGAYAVAALQRTPSMFGLLATALMSASVLPSVLATVAWTLSWEWLDRDGAEIAAPAAGWVFAGWMAIVGFRAMRLLLGVDGDRALVLAAAFALCALPAHVWEPAPQVWYTAEAEYDEGPRPDIEATYYAQPGLVRNQVAALAPQRPGVTDLYYLGVAGTAYERVFMKEVQAAGSLLDRRFGTAGRSATLINSPTTVHTVPLANLPNLRTTLAGIAAKMDTEQDVLFLFLSSHGDRDVFYADYWPLGLNNISSAELASALDDAGIKWRVIVISACSSGSFIEALRDDRTLVITDARADRDSYNGTDDATYSFFGQAFFGEALRHHASFVEAFESARDAVTRREREEGLTPSDPQVAVGTLIHDKLRELEAGARADQSASIR
jgi:hypothetical protein